MHMRILDVHTKKLDNRSMQVINLRREPDTKSYRVYDPVGKKIHVSRDVIFEEIKGWSTLLQGENDNHDMGSFSVPEIYEESNGNHDNAEFSHVHEMGGEDYMTPPHSPVSGISETVDSSLSQSSVGDTEQIELDQELLFVATDEPRNYEQEAKDKNWRLAMEKEIDSIEKNGTWKLTELPIGHKIIDLKWVYKLKKDVSGNVVRHNARLVAKGYVQEYGIDYDEVYAPVTRLETVRLLLALAVKNDWQVHHLDVKTVFLNGDINEEAPRAWYDKLNSCLEKLGFKRCPSEHAVYTRRIKDDVLIIGIYVDDILVTEVNQGDGFIELRQSGYAKKLLLQAGLADCNSTIFPMDPKEQLIKYYGGKPVDNTKFRSLVGGLRKMNKKDVGVKIPFLDKDNYQHWKVKMHIHMISQDEAYVDCIERGPHVPMRAATGNEPSVPKPRHEWSDPDIEQVRKDKKVMNILFNGVDADMFDNIINCKTAKEVWDTIQIICDGTEQVRENKMQLLIQQYEHFHNEESESLTDIFSRFQKLLNALKLHGRVYQTKDSNLKFLRSLPKEWKPMTVSLRNSQDYKEFTLERLYGILKTYELEIEQDERMERGKKKRRIHCTSC
ncbi:hypothetical protein AgCh_032969 [Apium graveolens]